jgi:hypothetical protein
LTNTSTGSGGATLTYVWAFVKKPSSTAAFSPSATSLSPSFVTDKVGDYIVQLTATDTGTGSTSSTQKTITVNNPPKAQFSISATPPNSPGIFVCRQVTLDGSASTDDGVPSAPLGYSWSISNRPLGSVNTITNPQSATAFFAPDKVDSSTPYTVNLTVTDGLGLASTAQQSFTAGIYSTGQTYYQTMNSFISSACSSCHAAGRLNTTITTGPNLAPAEFTTDKIVSALSTGLTPTTHLKTGLDSTVLRQRAADLRIFLDSTPCL